MKFRENQKITLTIGQLRRLISEAKENQVLDCVGYESLGPIPKGHYDEDFQDKCLRFIRRFKRLYSVKSGKDPIYVDDIDIVDGVGFDGNTIMSVRDRGIFTDPDKEKAAFDLIANYFQNTYSASQLRKHFDLKSHDFTGKYAHICQKLSMTDGPGKTPDGLSYIAKRDKMSYADNFKYGDLFRRCPFSEFGLAREMANNYGITAIWECNDDPDLLLVYRRKYGAMLVMNNDLIPFITKK